MLKTAAASVAVAIAASFIAPPVAASAQLGPQARIWVDGDRDYFRRGDRLQVRFTSDRSAYVAVIHVDTDGTLDFLYPSSPWDDGYVRAGHVYSVPQGRYSSWPVRGRSGIGYLYIVASDEPLDFSYFGGPYRGSWDWSYAGRNVRGDPYLALEQITRMLVPGSQYGGYSVDYYSYHVDGRHTYPSYACGVNRWGGERGWGWTPRYGSCDRLVIFLRQYPSYYDARRYRGDRRVYLRGDPLPEVRHGYKAPARSASGSSGLVPSPRSGQSGADGVRSDAPAEQPDRRRPTLERRGTGTQAQPAARTPEARPSSGGTARPAPRPSGGSSGGTARPAPSSRGSSGGTARPAPRPSGGSSGGTARPATRPSGGSSGGTARPTPSSRGSSGGTARPASQPRSRGGSGGGSARPAPASSTRSSGGERSSGSTERSGSRRGGGGGYTAANSISPA